MEMNSSVSKQSNVNEDDEKLMQDLFNVGIGTSATRAGIIEKLVSSGFLERVGECNQPTKDAKNLSSESGSRQWNQFLSERHLKIRRLLPIMILYMKLLAVDN